MCTMQSCLQDQRERIEKIRAEQGDEAAKREEHGQLGAAIGALGCAAGYAGIGTMICPGVGTVVGAAVGYVVGANKGSKNETAGDNVRTAVDSGFSIFGFLKGM